MEKAEENTQEKKQEEKKEEVQRTRREPKPKKPAKEAKEPQAAPAKGDKSKSLGIGVDRNTNFSEWYAQVILKAELIEFYDVSGCYILRPWSFSMWEKVQDFFNGEIKALGVQNAYFPLFISEKALLTEKDHIEGFAPEVAWVTRSGDTKLGAPIAVRPTSETIMYPAYAKWIRSHRDLPLKLNQWCNVVRWEFKHPTPFLRSREFLWQEGHTAYSNLEDASKEVLDILELYRQVYEKLLAVPVIKGKKTEKEKFPGGLYTTTIETFIPLSGRAVQAATSHNLGQNFSKMFNIQFENAKGEKEYAWQNSWGLTTRSLGVMIMVHGDDKGLVLPPNVAPLQVVIVPIYRKDKSNEDLDTEAKKIVKELNAVGIRSFFDDSTIHNHGFKYNHWELKGVPIHYEFGHNDLEKDCAIAVRRDKAGKETVAIADIVSRTRALLDDIQQSLFDAAKKQRDERIITVTKWEDFVPALEKKCMVLAPWCDKMSCEESVKDKSSDKKKEATNKQSKKDAADKKKPAADGKAEEEKVEDFEPLTGAAKSLCIPFDQPALEPGTKCFNCEDPAKHWVYWGRSF